MKKKTESITVRITKEEREKIDKLVKLKKEKSLNQVVQEAINNYFKHELINPYLPLSKWELDDRKKIDFRHGKDIEYLNSDLLEITQKELHKIYEKYENNKSKKNIALILSHFGRVLYAQKNYDDFVIEEEKQQHLREEKRKALALEIKRKIASSMEDSAGKEKNE